MEKLNSERKYVKGWPSEGSLEAKGVNARYRSDLPLVIKNLNFKIEKGEKIGIVGPSGSGKSTLLYLLTKNLELDVNGKNNFIKIDDEKISRLNLR